MKGPRGLPAEAACWKPAGGPPESHQLGVGGEVLNTGSTQTKPGQPERQTPALCPGAWHGAPQTRGTSRGTSGSSEAPAVAGRVSGKTLGEELGGQAGRGGWARLRGALCRQGHLALDATPCGPTRTALPQARGRSSSVGHTPQDLSPRSSWEAPGQRHRAIPSSAHPR